MCKYTCLSTCLLRFRVEETWARLYKGFSPQVSVYDIGTNNIVNLNWVRMYFFKKIGYLVKLKCKKK